MGEREQRKRAAHKDTVQYMGQLCRGQQIILRGGQQIGTFLATFKSIQSPMAMGEGNEYTLLWATNKEPKRGGQQIGYSV